MDKVFILGGTNLNICLADESMEKNLPGRQVE